MQEFVTINEKKYYPSSTLSEAFGYTADYIGKLAREEKILGLLIDRQWFIEKNSLEVYLHKIAIEKQIQKDVLSAMRKKERISFSRQKRQSDSGTHTNKCNQFLIATSEALVIMICGILVGVLGWISSSQSLTPEIFAQGIHEMTSFASLQMAPEFSRIKMLVPETQYASVTGSQVENESSTVIDDVTQMHPNAGSIFTELPVRSDSEKEFMMNGMNPGFTRVQFSDAVDIAVDASGEYYVRPVPHSKEESGVFVVQARKGNAVPQ